MLKAGVAIKDITPNVFGMGMMGWARFENSAHGVGMPIKARAFVFQNKQKKLAFVCAEIGFITIAIKRGVIEKLETEYPNLGFFDENVMLSATHTHSSPGGNSDYMMYNLSIPGYSKEVTETYINGIVEAILEADNKAKKATLYLKCGDIPLDKKVSFNRSIEAYNKNPEVKKVTWEERHTAVDREIKLLRIDDEEQKPLGMLNWFAVHGTSVHSDNNLVHPDNKGYAAKHFEKALTETNKDFVGAFAQSNCGDVTPNFKYYEDMKFCRGEFEDDYKSAEFNGIIQYETAKELFDNISAENKLSTEIDYIHMYVDFSKVEVDEKFTNGLKGQKTGSAAIGIKMLTGTAEGPGIGKELEKVLTVLSNSIYLKDKVVSKIGNNENNEELLERKKVQGNKTIFAEMGKQRILGKTDLEGLNIPDASDPIIPVLKDWVKNKALCEKPWTPNILPLQIFILGELAIAGMPSEVTTIAGKRLENTLLAILSQRGIKKVVLSCYTNAYSGYVTTKEEYDVQLYEGASTHFGQWTLAAYQTKFEILANHLLKDYNERELDSNLKPYIFSEEILAKRAFKK